MTQTTLLLIDEDVAVLSRMADLLSGADYHVLKTSDASHGGVLFDEEHPDLVILEVHTSRGAGWSQLERIAPTTKVIIVSQQGLEEDIVRGLDAGAVDYLTKPFRSEELLARVRVQLRSSRPVAEPAPVVEVVAVAAESPIVTRQMETVPVPSTAALSSEAVRERRAAGRETVVMPYDDEHMLIDAHAEGADLTLPEVANDLALGRRLHAARQQRRITLVRAENDLNIRMYYLQAIEEEKFTLLPSAVLTETFVSKYAAYLGQDAKRATDEYRQLHYTQHTAPPTALGGTAPPRSVPGWVIRLVAIVLAVGICIALILWIDPLGAANLLQQVRQLVGLR